MKRALVLAVVLCSCGGSTPHHAAPGRPASGAQALVLARVLEADREHGGAQFAATLAISGKRVQASGRVDFRSGRGTAVLRPADATAGPPRTYFWTRRYVLAQTVPGRERYRRQAPNPQNDPVHAMIGFINLLAAETIDNTANITDQDARYLGHARIGGAATDVYRYGPTGSTTLWVLSDGGLLRRVRTTRVTGGLTVDLTAHGPVTIELPRQR